MKRIGPVVDVLVCVVFVVVCPILASTSVDKDEPGDGYARKTEGSAQTSENSKESKLSPHRGDYHDPTVGELIRTSLNAKISPRIASAVVQAERTPAGSHYK